MVQFEINSSRMSGCTTSILLDRAVKGRRVALKLQQFPGACKYFPTYLCEKKTRPELFAPFAKPFAFSAVYPERGRRVTAKNTEKYAKSMK